MPPILAHGALGPFDEIIFLGAAAVFLGMMALSWLRSQELPADEVDAEALDRDAAGERFELE